MTMSASAADPGRLGSPAYRRRLIPAVVWLISCAVLAMLSMPAVGATYVGASVARFDDIHPWETHDRAFSLRAGWSWTESLAIEAGIIDRRAELRNPPILGPYDGFESNWRALHLGPRVTLPLGDRWHARIGAAIAHVATDFDRLGGVAQPDGSFALQRVGVRRHSSWGWLASAAIGVDLTPRHSLWVEWQRLHAGLDERCDTNSDGFDCNQPDYVSTDGLGLAWMVRFQ